MNELQDSIEQKIKQLDNRIELQSKIIGDKIREGEKNNSEELDDLKSKLNPEKSRDKKSDKKTDKKNTGSKKSQNKKIADKKKKGKKGDSENWIDFQNLHLFNGVGTRGELELYFKFLEDLKNNSEQLKKTKESLEQLMNSGINKELAGIGYEQSEGPYELAFVNSDEKREKFSFKRILTVGCEI